MNKTIPIGHDASSTMKKAVVVMIWALLSAGSAVAAQVCPGGIPQTTPATEFTDHGDGTVTHHPTGLMWKRCVEGLTGAACASGTATGYTWQGALQLADGHDFAGYSDWRVPNIKELTSIVEMSCYDPAINLSVFPNDPGLRVWSASPDANHSNYAWYVNFADGGDHYNPRDTTKWLRLVRDGQ